MDCDGRAGRGVVCEGEDCADADGCGKLCVGAFARSTLPPLPPLLSGAPPPPTAFTVPPLSAAVAVVSDVRDAADDVVYDASRETKEEVEGCTASDVVGRLGDGAARSSS